MFKRNTDRTAHGYLIDWDLSLDLDLAAETSVGAQLERMGTWQFLAIRLSEPNDGKPVIQNRIDDVESFYHLMLWMALRYTAHQLRSDTLSIRLHENFDARYRDVQGQPVIGGARRPNILSGDLIQEACFANAGIRLILKEMRLVLCERYTDPGSVFEGRHDERKAAEQEQALMLKILEDPKWLPDLFTNYLHDGNIDWKTNEGRVNHTCVKPLQVRLKRPCA